MVISSSGKELIVALMRDAATSLTRLQSIRQPRGDNSGVNASDCSISTLRASRSAREGGSSSQGDTSTAAPRLPRGCKPCCALHARRRLWCKQSPQTPAHQVSRTKAPVTTQAIVPLSWQHYAFQHMRVPSSSMPRGGDHWRVSSLLFGRATRSVDWRMAAITLCTSDRPASLAILAELLAFGADVETATRDRWRLRPLHVAGRVAYGATVARALLAFGATPLSTSADGKRAVEQASPSNLAVLAVLRRSGAVWTATKGPKVLRAALVTAVASGRLLRMAELLAHRTSPDSYDQHGASALHVACACADADAIRALLAAGASANLSMRDGSGRRPLHISASLGASRCARLLLSSGADVLLADERQRLPLDYCRSDDKFVRALLMRALLTKGLSSGRRRSDSGGGGNSGRWRRSSGSDIGMGDF